jgi:hypothetical protein
LGRQAAAGQTPKEEPVEILLRVAFSDIGYDLNSGLLRKFLPQVGHP